LYGEYAYERKGLLLCGITANQCGSFVTTIQVTAPCGATITAAARAPTMAGATRTTYGQARLAAVTITEAT